MKLITTIPVFCRYIFFFKAKQIVYTKIVRQKKKKKNPLQISEHLYSAIRTTVPLETCILNVEHYSEAKKNVHT